MYDLLVIYFTFYHYGGGGFPLFLLCRKNSAAPPPPSHKFMIIIIVLCLVMHITLLLNYHLILSAATEMLRHADSPALPTLPLPGVQTEEEEGNGQAIPEELDEVLRGRDRGARTDQSAEGRRKEHQSELTKKMNQEARVSQCQRTMTH